MQLKEVIYHEIFNIHQTGIKNASVKLLTFQLLLPGVQMIGAILFYRSEMSQYLHELQEIYSIIPTFFEEGIYYPVTKWIYCQFWDSKKIFSTERSTVSSIQTRETTV